MKTAIILAAGRGERMQPITKAQPKALCHVHGIPLIEHHVSNLAKSGYQKIIINHAHLGGMIRRHLGNGKRWGVEIVYSPEPPGALETGGGIVNALPLLGEEPFIVVNSDIFTDYNFASLTLNNSAQAHLVLINRPQYKQDGDFGLSDNNMVTNKNNYTFIGIACYRPIIFQNHRPTRFSITPILRQLVNDNKVSGEIHSGQWLDVGTPARLLLANNKSL
jgi:MurNAc alpha-1-phosphate uridylyltransferase